MGFRVVPDTAGDKIRSGVTDWYPLAGVAVATWPHGLDAIPDVFVATAHTNTGAVESGCSVSIWNVGDTNATSITRFPDFASAPPGTQYQIHYIAVMP